MKQFPALTFFLIFSGAVLAQPSYRELNFTIPGDAEKLLLADLNGDSLQELITVIEQGLRVYVQTASGFDFEQGFIDLEFEGQAIGWDIALEDSEPRRATLVTLENGREARRWQLTNNNEFDNEIIASNLPGFISKGINRLHFFRDINEDGFNDLLIPGAGVINILINNQNSDFQSALSIRSEMRLRTQLDINRFNRSAGQAVRIPVLELRDINGDDAADLVSRTDEQLAAFLANPAGDNYFPNTPSYSLDIEEIEARLGEFDIDNLDFSNLTGILALTHEEILDDVNNDGIEDLLLREGGKVSLFQGLPDGMNLDQPQQVLRSGGNVLSTFLYDENEDGLKDLWLWRVEPISVGDIFVWLALSGSIAIEAFIYPNDGDSFARRPSRKVSVNLKFPSVLRLANAYGDLSDEVDALEAADAPPSVIANINSNVDRADLLVLAENQLQLFLDSIEPESDDKEDEEFLAGLGYSRQQDSYEIDIRNIIENVAFVNQEIVQLTETLNPDNTLEIGDSTAAADLIAVNLNSDGLDDVFVFTHHDASQITGILLLSN